MATICGIAAQQPTQEKYRNGMNIQFPPLGLQHALHMTLNIEQYEYMTGPNYGAGIRILLHDQLEGLPMKDLSTAIPSGAQAMIGGEIVLVGHFVIIYFCDNYIILSDVTTALFFFFFLILKLMSHQTISPATKRSADFS